MDQMRSVFLVGFMGVGKSSVGAVVADRLGLRLIDLDEEIVGNAGVSIREIFAVGGESAFREAEREELARWVEAEGVVVATGGGAFCSQANRDLIHRSGGVSVFLDLPWREIADRLARDHSDRPMYVGTDQARRLFEERLPQYRLAMIQLACRGDETASDVAERVLEALREVPCATSS
jgi:shikimate kinase